MLFMSTTQCQEEDNHGMEDNTVVEDNETILLEIPPFPDSVLSYDPYNGVTLYLGKLLLEWQTQKEEGEQQPNNQSETMPSSNHHPQEEDHHHHLGGGSLLFRHNLDRALQFWKAEGRKGIWIHVPPIAAHWIPACIQAGFDFHNVVRKEEDSSNDNDNTNEATKQTLEQRIVNQDERNILVRKPTATITTTTTTTTIPGLGSDNGKPPSTTLILSQWLPDTPSKLPLGPSHQVGVGIVVLNPSDPSQMLCVQEQSGPGK
jgi:hypothetical protein